MTTLNELRLRRDLTERVRDYLKTHCQGPANAKPRFRLMDLFGYVGDERSFRLLYCNYACSCDDGIYWARDWRDVETWRAYLTNDYGEQLANRKVKNLLENRPELCKPMAGVQQTLPGAEPKEVRVGGAA